MHPGASQIADNARTFVVNHVDPATGRLTSPVVMLGFESPKQAQKAYQANFPRDRRKVGPIREMPASQLRDRVNALRQNGRPALETSVPPGSKHSKVSSVPIAEAGDRFPKRAPLFSSNDLEGVERASPALLDSIGRKRFISWATPNSDPEKFLDMRGAEAAAFGPEVIILRTNPRKAAVLEEFLHGTQERLGITERLGRNGLGSAETHVKDFMLRHAKMLGLSSEDIQRIRTSKIEDFRNDLSHENRRYFSYRKIYNNCRRFNFK